MENTSTITDNNKTVEKGSEKPEVLINSFVYKLMEKNNYFFFFTR